MKRTAMEKLVAWKSSDERKPMVLKGARQVGKTWLMKEFGKNLQQLLLRKRLLSLVAPVILKKKRHWLLIL